MRFRLRLMRHPFFAAILILLAIIMVHNALQPVTSSSPTFNRKTNATVVSSTDQYIWLDFGEAYDYRVPRTENTEALLEGDLSGRVFWVKSQRQVEDSDSACLMITALKDDTRTYLTIEESTAIQHRNAPLFITIAALFIAIVVWQCIEGRRDGVW